MNIVSSKRDLAFVLLICISLAAVVFMTYRPVFNHDFINYDDNLYVVENYQVQNGLTFENVKWAFMTVQVSNWHPVTWLSYMLDVSLFGLDAGKHHMTSVIFHSLNAVLLFFVFHRTTYQLWPSALIAALFAVHPVHVESVAWIAERKDVLSLFFMLITFLFYINYVKSSKKIAYWAAVFFFAVGLMAKPMLVTLPCLLLLFDYWPLKRVHFNKDYHVSSLRSEAVPLLIEKIPFLLLSAISSVVTMVVQNKGGAVVSVASTSVYTRFANAIIAYFEYMKKLVYPVDLILPYPYPESVYWPDLLSGFILMALITLLAIRYLRNKPYLLVGWLWFAGSMIPVIGIVRVGAQAMADRYTYIPFIGLYLIIVFTVNDFFSGWPKRRAFANAALLSVFVLFAYIANTQVGYWKDSISVFEHTLSVNNRNWVAHSSLGGALLSNNKVSEAMSHFSEAVSINPHDAVAHTGVAACYYILKRFDEAEKSFLRAIALNPNYETPYYHVACIYIKQHRFSEAAYNLNKYIELDPYSARAYHAMGVMYSQMGDIDKADSCMIKAKQLGFAFER